MKYMMIFVCLPTMMKGSPLTDIPSRRNGIIHRIRLYKGDIIKDKRRIYIHYYYSIEKGADGEQAFDKRITELFSELQEGKFVEEHKKGSESELHRCLHRS